MEKVASTPIGRYTVDMMDFGSALTFTIGQREDLTEIDRFILWNRLDGKAPQIPTDPTDRDEFFAALPNSRVVPEPSALALLSIGLAGVFVRARRKTNC